MSKLCIFLLIFTLHTFASVAKWNRKACHLPIDQMLEHNFSSEQMRAICNASIYYDIDVLFKDGKSVIIAGENSHFRDKEAAAQGDRLLEAFVFRGIENLTWKNKGLEFNLYKASKFMDHGSTVRDAISLGYYFHIENDQEKIFFNLSDITSFYRKGFGPPEFKNAWVSDAKRLGIAPSRKTPVTVHLERSKEINEIIDDNCLDGVASCPDIYLVDMRNAEMRSNIVNALKWFPKQKHFLVLTGHAHVKGLSRGLVCFDDYSLHKVTRGASCKNAPYPGHFETLEADSCESIWDF